MTLQVPHFQLSSSPTFVNFGQNDWFSEKRIYFWKNMKILLFSPQISLKVQEGWFATDQNNFLRKIQFFNFWQIFFVFRKQPKISNLSRDKAPKFQNNVILNIKNALTGGKKVKTQLLRRRGHRNIQKESYLTSKKL